MGIFDRIRNAVRGQRPPKFPDDMWRATVESSKEHWRRVDEESLERYEQYFSPSRDAPEEYWRRVGEEMSRHDSPESLERSDEEAADAYLSAMDMMKKEMIREARERDREEMARGHEEDMRRYEEEVRLAAQHMDVDEARGIVDETEERERHHTCWEDCLSCAACRAEELLTDTEHQAVAVRYAAARQVVSAVEQADTTDDTEDVVGPGRGHGARDCDPGLVGPAGAQGDYRPDWVIWAEQESDEWVDDGREWEGDVEDFARNMSPADARVPGEVVNTATAAKAAYLADMLQRYTMHYECDHQFSPWPEDPDGGELRIVLALQRVLPYLSGEALGHVETALAPATVKPVELIGADEGADEGGFVEEETRLSPERHAERGDDRGLSVLEQRRIDDFSERLEEPDEDTDDSHEDTESGPRAGVDDHDPVMGFGFVAPSRVAGGVGCAEGPMRAARNAMGHLHEQRALEQHRTTERAGQVSLWMNDTQADGADRHESVGWDVTD
jgi:hypothetical protein